MNPRCPKCGGATREANGKAGRGYVCLRRPDCNGFLRPTILLSGEERVIVASQEYIGACVIAAGLAGRSDTDEWSQDEIADIAAAIAKKLSDRIKK